MKEPYLATAMRLSLPTAVDEPNNNREELLKEIEKLESEIADFQNDMSDEPSVTPPSVEKRYLEWPGKRSVMKPVESGFGFQYSPFKIWNNYSNKANGYGRHRNEPFKRWAEFVGKRHLSGNRPFVNRKRWYEFVGKRYDPALYMWFPKRYMGFYEKN